MSKPLKSTDNFSIMNTNTKRICRFLVATEGTHHFLSASTLYIPYQDYLYLKNNINSFRNNTDDRKWQPIIINDTEYLIKVVHYKEKTIMAVISADDILTPLRKLNIGKNGQISLKKAKEFIAFNSLD